MIKSQSKRKAFRLGRFISMVTVIVILIGAGVLLLPRIEWSPSSEQDTAVIGVPSAVPQETDTPDPTETSEENRQRTLATTEDEQFRLYVMPESEGTGGYSQVVIESDTGEVRHFDWRLTDDTPAFAPTLQLSDLNNDDVNELIVILSNSNPSGVLTQELHVLKASDLTEMPVPSAGKYLEQNVDSQVIQLNGYVWIRLNVNGQIYEKAVDSKMMEAWGDKIDFNYSIKYTVQTPRDRTYATVDAVIGAGAEKIKFGSMDVNYTLTEQGIVIDPTSFHIEDELAGEIPLHAIQAGEEYIALRDKENEVDLLASLGKPIKQSIKQLGPDAGTFNGMYTKSLTYEGLELMLYSAKGDIYYLVNMRVTDKRYATSLGIQVGDSAQRVNEVYPFIEIAKDGRTPPRNFAYALSNDFYINLYIDIKNDMVKELYFEYLID
ncbi:hypothetical protein [Bacillus sp. FJAT-28004]|uniref:hypothetical protein n=1 Tax=Bacillus sp. FJAT-28004 TaxID=1679165 RepID=UPI000B2B29B2|nr:hypothetical protein [Bacillus sp. FJAT-28004]